MDARGITEILGIAGSAWSLYQQLKADWMARHPAEPDPFPPDSVLIGLAKEDNAAFKTEIDALRRKLAQA